MKLTIFVLAILSILMFSCKKKKVESAIPTPVVNNPTPQNEYYSLKVGSYWIYENIFIDSNGLETNMGTIDTVKIINDTIINGNLFSVFQSHPTGGTVQIYFLRDSSGITVNSYGGIHFNPFDNSINTFEDPNLTGFSHTTQTLILPNMSISVPAGTFGEILDRQFSTFFTNGNPINSCGDQIFVEHSYYSKNIGLLKYNWGYFNQIFDCQYQEKRLVEYYIPQ
ncbi:MAG: hypothetical protein ACSHXL_06835 [Bacteroidota bacterium]